MDFNRMTETRRQCVKQFMFGTAAALTGPAWASRVLAEVTSTGPGAGVLRIRPSAYPVLAAPGGSVQLKFIDAEKPLTLNRLAADEFVTLDTICTHSQCQVGRYREHIISQSPLVTAFYMRCPCHGSRYDIEGKVFRDANGVSTEPAKKDLGTYFTQYDAAADIVTITIPALALHINSIAVHQQGPGETFRLKLVFPVTYGAIYQIHYQPTLEAPLTLASFSRTATGVANQTQAGPEVEGDFTAYVDATGPTGFFAVGVKLIQVSP